MTAADLAAGAMVALATAFVAGAVVRAGRPMPVSLLLLLAGSAIVVFLARSWMHSRHQPARRLVARTDGSLWLHMAGQVPSRATIGVGTRLLGPSVFLDLLVDSHPSGTRVRTWLTPLDVPSPAIRRWGVLLPRCGRSAG